ncbi:protein-methionine-sulfoxide reductase catalytic subunit MsrP [Sneathiella glossodoripedis]|uniref:protein-methionine-sulfoxide reductase catalytic subunit MsrP n=1 Tax=Sneathiella glossodoripedis TaxID=418853 RepID=UPI00047134B2|nr:protein-methionine-sulfoxide reductase catalytic subunit MsrP [Sneathiella glossodoripedis]
MLIKIRKSWELSENAVLDEGKYLNRRQILKGLGIGGLIAASPSILSNSVAATSDDPSAHLYPVARNTAYEGGRPLTPEKIATTYNNFYEFGSHKEISKAAQALKIRPWSVLIDGEVEQEQQIDIDDLLSRMPLEERIYRHRCVEAWSMVVPYSGFALKELVKLAKPTSKARYLIMQTFEDKEVATGQRQFWYPWPYTEGLSMEEAAHDLAFIATGLYGKPIPKQNGAPLRLAVPWKYGFKHAKSLVRFTFSEKRPVSFWQKLNENEYGFWANVNPEVRHPRWSQATERDLATNERIPTQFYNGYAEEVAGLYTEIGKKEPLFK